MISIIIPTLNEERRLPRALAALVPAMVEGVVKQVLIVDGGSTDGTCAIADDAGADVIVATARGRGQQLAEGATHAKAEWMLFLHADTVLEAGWHEVASRFIADVSAGRRPPSAATFQFAMDTDAWQARAIEAGVKFRTRLLKLPYGDQGLLISKTLYREVGGMRAMPLFEDVDIVRRIGGRRLVTLPARAVTSAERYQTIGYVRRVLRNWSCLARFFLGQSSDSISARYHQR